MSDEPTERPPWQRLFNIEPGELVPVVLACGYFFCVLACNYVLRPVRDEMGIERGAEGLTWLMTGTLIVTICINPVFSLLVSRWSRRRFIPLTYHFLAANLIAFYVVMWAVPHRASELQDTFFIWMSVFNLFALSVFWGLMSDLFTNEQSKRLYPLIGVGGTLGAISGSQLTSSLVTWVGPTGMLLVAAGFLELAVGFALVLARRGDQARALKPEQVERTRIWDGIVLVAKRPYLRIVVVYILLQTGLNTLLYFQQVGIVHDYSSDPAERTQFLADINTWVNVATLVLQLFVSGRLISRLGIVRTLLIVPSLLALGFCGLSLSSMAITLAIVQITVRAGEYAAARPARETLYTVVSRTERYQSKSFIDTFVYRSGDALAGWANQGLAEIGLSLPLVALVSVPVAACWIGTAFLLGRHQEALARRSNG